MARGDEMTDTKRREQIEHQAIIEYPAQTDRTFDERNGFIDGAEWADANPINANRDEALKLAKKYLNEIGYAKGIGVDASVFVFRGMCREALAKISELEKGE